MREKEATVWCPLCMVEKYTVWRIPTENEHVFTHETDPPNRGEKLCTCGEPLERK